MRRFVTTFVVTLDVTRGRNSTSMSLGPRRQQSKDVMTEVFDARHAFVSLLMIFHRCLIYYKMVGSVKVNKIAYNYNLVVHNIHTSILIEGKDDA